MFLSPLAPLALPFPVLLLRCWGCGEQGCAHALLAHLGGLALGLKPPLAHEAVAAGDLEGDYHPVTDREVRGPASDLLDDAHRLVAEDEPLGHERGENLVEVEVRAADGRGRDADHRVGWLL